MKKPTVSRAGILGLLTGTLIMLFAFVLPVQAGSTNTHDQFTNLTAQELAELVTSNSATVLDANGEWYRQSKGIIPGAKLLSSYSDFDIASELPADKNAKLVFYCSTAMCTAAPIAAGIAQSAGYSDVNVLSTGIAGWIQAGFEVEKV